MPADREHQQTIDFTQPVNLHLTFSLLRRGPGDPTCWRDGSRLWRTSRMPTGPVSYVLDQRSPTRVEARAWGPGAEAFLDDVPSIFGDELDTFAPRVAVLADAHRRFPGLRVPRTGRLLEALIPAVIEQKVLGVDAFAAWRRLLTTFGDAAPGPLPDRMRVFPTAATWAAIPSWEWHRAGVDPQRARTAQACARLGDRLEHLAVRHPDDPAAVYRGLRTVPGVGIWTAAEVGSRALSDADAVPFGDYHLGRLVGMLIGERDLDDAGVADVLQPWRPHRFVVVRLLQLSPLVRVERRGPRMARVDHRRL